MTDDRQVFLSTMPAGRRERRLALVFVLVSFGIFLAVAPFATMQYVPMPAFIPIVETALVISDLITAVLLYGQFNILRSRALLVLASGYVFTAFITVAHVLIFPGVFSPTGLFGAGPQSGVWLYIFWHAGFPLLVIAYALLKDDWQQPIGSSGLLRSRTGIAIFSSVAAVLVVVCGLVLFVTAGQGALPAVVEGNRLVNAGRIALPSGWILSAIALILLWRRLHTVLDLWITVVMCVWLFDVALSSILTAGRFDLGWYAGRIYGLLAGSLVLMVLLIEKGRLYTQLVAAHQSEQEKSTDLKRLNALIEASVEVGIRERKQAEEDLLKAGALQSAIFNSANFSSIATDAKGVIQIFNVGAERMLGYAAADVMNKITPADISDPQEVITRAEVLSVELGTPITPGFEALVFKASRGIEDIYELTYIRKDGSRFAAVVSVTALRGAENDIIGYLLIGTDNTARKHVEAERARLFQVLQDKNTELERATFVAERANHTKDSFLATMSHEIRTPLTGMLGMLEVLSLTPLNQEQEEMLRATWDSSRSLLRIVNDILDWSKIEEGKLVLAPQATSIPQLLQEVVNTYSRVASAKSLALWQHADARLSPAHIVDPLRLSQVMNNFVSNAIKFTARGEVELRAELLGQVDSGERIRFSVKDTGIGIAKEDQEHLFQRYWQGGADTARMYGGTGLGLAICRHLAELLDGFVELESEPGQGTTFSFTVTLPVSAKPEMVVLSTHPELAHRTVTPLFDGSRDTPVVLAVDDHPINRDLLARQLVLLGLQVETAEDGRMALSMWRKGRFALLITDCHMPEMDGYALTQAIRKIEAEEARPRTPIIAWTANALAEESKKCQAAGMDELLIKPNNMAQLRMALTTCLSIADSDNSQSTTSLDDANTGTRIGPIDYAVLNQVVPDSAAHVQILHDFQSHIRADYAKLLQILEQGDLANMEITAHRMKGSCRMVGAESLAKACAAIELAASNGDLTEARAMSNALDDAARLLDTYLDELSNSAKKIKGEPYEC